MNPWTRPIVAALIISAVGACGLSFLRSQQPSEEVGGPRSVVAEPPVVHTDTTERVPAALPEAPPVAALDKRGPEPKPESEKPRLPSAATEAPPPTPTPAPAPVVAAPPSTTTGVVKFAGTAPRRAIIKMDADPKCAAMHADEPPASEEVVVNTDGTLRNVFIYVKAGLEGKTFPVPKTPAVITQHGCAYRPRVLGMMAKQPLLIRNDDDTLHNVHAQPTKSKEFNVGQPNQGMETIRTFAAPEVMVKFKCDVHPWMAAYIGVVDNPYYAVTGDAGTFELKDLPPGTYTLAAWHETLGEQQQTVTVPGSVTFTFGR